MKIAQRLRAPQCSATDSSRVYLWRLKVQATEPDVHDATFVAVFEAILFLTTFIQIHCTCLQRG